MTAFEPAFGKIEIAPKSLSVDFQFENQWPLSHQLFCESRILNLQLRIRGLNSAGFGEMLVPSRAGCVNTMVPVQPKVSLHELAALVGKEHVHAATPADAIAGVLPQLVIEPGSVEEVSRVLRFASANHLRVAPRGGDTKMEWGNPPRGLDLILSTRRLDRVIEHAWADMTATVQAGCTVAHFEQHLAEHRQRLAIDPLWPDRATIGGILATQESGTLRHRFGSLRDLIIGITLVLADGTVAKSGGKVVKNVAGYDLPKLLTGSLGTLGVITEATFRLYPQPTEIRTLTFRSATVEIMNSLILKILDSTLAPTGLQVRARAGETPQIDVRFEGVAAAIDSQIKSLLGLTTLATQIDSPPAVWKAREELWQGPSPALICKATVLPSQWSEYFFRVQKLATTQALGWRIVAQAMGVGTLRIEGPNAHSLITVLDGLKSDTAAWGGSLVILHCPAELKGAVDVWGKSGDDFPLMRRVKEQFDPGEVLNPGRFLGGL